MAIHQRYVCDKCGAEQTLSGPDATQCGWRKVTITDPIVTAPSKHIAQSFDVCAGCVQTLMQRPAPPTTPPPAYAAVRPVVHHTEYQPPAEPEVMPSEEDVVEGG